MRAEKRLLDFAIKDYEPIRREHTHLGEEVGSAIARERRGNGGNQERQPFLGICYYKTVA